MKQESEGLSGDGSSGDVGEALWPGKALEWFQSRTLEARVRYVSFTACAVVLSIVLLGGYEFHHLTLSE